MEKKLLEIFATILDIDSNMLSLDSSKLDLVEWDSLASIRIIAEFEEVFNKEVPLEDMESISKIKDFLKYLSE